MEVLGCWDGDVHGSGMEMPEAVRWRCPWCWDGDARGCEMKMPMAMGWRCPRLRDEHIPHSRTERWRWQTAVHTRGSSAPAAEHRPKAGTFLSLISAHSGWMTLSQPLISCLSQAPEEPGEPPGLGAPPACGLHLPGLKATVKGSSNSIK